MRPNASGGTVFSAACPRLLSRPVTWTVAPAPASAWAAASPIPPVPPVTSATLEARSDFARGEALLKISPKAVCRISIMYCKAAIPDGGGGAKTFVIKPGPDGVFLAKVVEDQRVYFQKRVMTVVDWSDHISPPTVQFDTRRTLPPAPECARAPPTGATDQLEAKPFQHLIA